MIDSITLGNVRLFENTESFKLKNLTVFTGTNSSGKSTILKILPLLRQTQGIREALEIADGTLRLKGGQVDLGQFKTFVSNNDTNKTISLGFTFSNVFPKGIIHWLKSADSPEVDLIKISEEEKFQDVPYSLNCLFEFTTVSQEGNAQSIATNVLEKASFELCHQGEVLLPWSIQNHKKTEKGYITLTVPKSFWNLASLGTYKPLDLASGNSADFFAIVKGILPHAIIAEGVQGQEEHNQENLTPPEKNFRRCPLPFVIDQCIDELKSVLLQTHYIGPLRSPGKRHYIADFDVAPGLDSAGEFLPFLLRERGEELILNFHPNGAGEIEEPLLKALSYWMGYLRTGSFNAGQEHSEINLSTKDGILFELKIQSPNEQGQFSVADSGFGYSQILPVIARGLLTEKDGTLIIEQPELHLHPALQVRLATFFMAMAKAGKQVLIETHSEHLVNAIRVAIAESDEENITDLCKIYFLEATQGSPRIYDLSITADGMLTEWPKSFFGDALELSTRLLKAQRKHLQKKKDS